MIQSIEARKFKFYAKFTLRSYIITNISLKGNGETKNLTIQLNLLSVFQIFKCIFLYVTLFYNQDNNKWPGFNFHYTRKLKKKCV